jgi:putative sigma-54 modulation protein
MDTHLTFRRMDATEAIKTYTESKLEKIKKYIQQPLDNHVVFSKERFQYLVEINVSGNGVDMHAVERNEDLYAAIDLVMDKVEKQLRRMRDKQKDKKNNASHRSFHLAVLSPHETSSMPPNVIKSKAFTASTLSIGEAIEKIQAETDPFLVFTNNETSRINILYKLKDGNFGLIDPTE